MPIISSVERDDFRSSSSIKTSSIQLMEWKDCDTIDKKIGFIIGRSIKLVFETFQSLWEGGWKIINFVVQSLPIDKITKAVSHYFGIAYSNVCHYVGKLANAFFNSLSFVYNHQLTKDSINWISIKAAWLKGNIIDPVLEFIVRKVKLIFKKIDKHILTPIQEYCCKKKPEIKEEIESKPNCLTAFLERTVIPFYKETISPKLQVIGTLFMEKILSPVCSVGKKLFVSGLDYVIVPVLKKCIIPGIETICNVTVAALGGVFTQPTKEEFLKEKVVNSNQVQEKKDNSDYEKIEEENEEEIKDGIDEVDFINDNSDNNKDDLSE